MVLDSVKHVLRDFILNGFKKKAFLDKRVSREFITMLLLAYEKNIKHRILIRMRFFGF